MRPAKPTTRSPGCWPWAIRAGRSSIKLAADARSSSVYDRQAPNPFGPSQDQGQSLRFQLQRNQDGRAVLPARASGTAARDRARREALARGERSAAQLLPSRSPQTLELLAQFSAHGSRGTGAADARCGSGSGGAERPGFRRRGRERGIAGHIRAGGGTRSLQVFFPSRELSTDNAAMIAAAAYPKLVAGDLADATSMPSRFFLWLIPHLSGTPESRHYCGSAARMRASGSVGRQQPGSGSS